MYFNRKVTTILNFRDFWIKFFLTAVIIMNRERRAQENRKMNQQRKKQYKTKRSKKKRKKENLQILNVLNSHGTVE